MTVETNGTLDAAEVAAPAKVNLALLVGPLRPDGFHELASLMVPVTLGDLVVVRRTPGEDLAVECAVCPGEQNLAARMVRELEARLERRFEVAVEVHKQIPAGAGLAGGSSDAAATLVALERLFELDLSPRLRYEVAAAVGSDVPFFLWPGPQLAMGRGQVLKDVGLVAPLSLVIAVPEVSLSTRHRLRLEGRGRPGDAARLRPPGAHAVEPRRRRAHPARHRRAGRERPRGERRRAAPRGRRPARPPARRGGGRRRP